MLLRHLGFYLQSMRHAVKGLEEQAAVPRLMLLIVVKMRCSMSSFHAASWTLKRLTGLR